MGDENKLFRRSGVSMLSLLIGGLVFSEQCAARDDKLETLVDDIPLIRLLQYEVALDEELTPEIGACIDGRLRAQWSSSLRYEAATFNWQRTLDTLRRTETTCTLMSLGEKGTLRATVGIRSALLNQQQRVAWLEQTKRARSCLNNSPELTQLKACLLQIQTKPFSDEDWQQWVGLHQQKHSRR